jgi:hypothetical protein
VRDQFKSYSQHDGGNFFAFFRGIHVKGANPILYEIHIPHSLWLPSKLQVHKLCVLCAFITIRCCSFMGGKFYG